MTWTVGSLFSGVGGFDVGFERAGFRVAWQCEIDRDAVSVLERHWPDVPRYGDIATVDPAELAPVDVVIFGSPCQDFSVAGKRAGLDGARSSLFGEAIRIIRGLRPAPAFCVWENVPGALSSAGGRDFGAVLDALAGAGALDICWRILDARWFGVPQRRRRLFVVADLGAERTAEVLFEPQSSSRHSAARGEARQGAAGDAADGAGVAVFPVAAFGGNRTSGPLEVATACTAHGGPHGRLDFESETFVVANSVTASAGHHGHSSPRGDGSDNLIAVAAPLTAGGHPNSNAPGRHREDDENLVAFHMTQDPINGAESPSLGAGSERGCATVAVAHALTVRHGATEDGTGRGTPLAASPDGMAVRRLMPVECERLMGWRDDHTRYRADGAEISDGARYRMIGNGVVAPVAAWIARRMRAVLEGDR